mgnify:CR=1 FL=1
MVNRQGLGLVEVLITLLLMGIAIIPIFGMFTGNVRHVAFNGERAIAQMLAQQVIERYRYEGLDYLKKSFSDYESSKLVLAHDPLLNSLLNTDEGFKKAAAPFSRSLMFIPMEGHHRCGQLICRVSWRAGQKRDSELFLKTIVCDGQVRNESK